MLYKQIIVSWLSLHVVLYGAACGQSLQSYT
jgi:hypothetical protein